MPTPSISGAGQSSVFAPARTEIVKTALVAFSLGALLVFLTGFSYSSAVHNAAHDTRHSLAFPCH